MIVAIASEGMRVAQHFGHCEMFTMYNTDTHDYKQLASPEHQPGMLPGYLKENGANVVIAGGMGERARQLFEAHGIKVFVGIDSTIVEAVRLYNASQLSSKGEFCAGHDHEHGEGCHHEG